MSSPTYNLWGLFFLVAMAYICAMRKYLFILWLKVIGFECRRLNAKALRTAKKLDRINGKSEILNRLFMHVVTKITGHGDNIGNA